MTIFLLMLIQDGCEIDGKKFPAEPKLAHSPYNKINVDFKDKPAVEACRELSKQSGVPIKWTGKEDETITVSAKNAPIVGVLAAIAKTKGCGFEEWMRGFQIPSVFFEPPVKAFQVRGPLAFVWHGRATWETYVGDNKLGMATRIVAVVYGAPGCHLSCGNREESPLSFDGAAQKDPLGTDTGLLPKWQYRSEALSVDKTTVETTVSIWAPTSAKQGVFEVKIGQSLKLGKKIVTIEAIEEDREETIVRVRMIHVDSLLLKKENLSKEEEARLQKVKGKWADLDIHSACAILKDGRRVVGSSGRKAGKEWEGNLNDVRFYGKNLNFDQLEIHQFESEEYVKIPFKIVDAPVK